jgi:anti-sigma regulatory factor (Ser/Thr protein kinase)
MPDLTPESRIATSMEDISRYVGEIRQLLQDLAARPAVDNVQLAKIATAVSEIQRLIPALLQR